MSRQILELDVNALKGIARYCNWIPALNGRQQEFINENYPGWNWNQIIPKLLREEILSFNRNEEKDLSLAYGLWFSSQIESISIFPKGRGSFVTIRKADVKTRVRNQSGRIQDFAIDSTPIGDTK